MTSRQHPDDIRARVGADSGAAGSRRFASRFVGPSEFGCGLTSFELIRVKRFESNRCEVDQRQRVEILPASSHTPVQTHFRAAGMAWFERADYF